MKAEIEVLQPGLFSTVQDLGRFGVQEYGVPLSGVMDRYAMRIANMLLGNAENDTVLEMTMQGPHLKFRQSAEIVLAGADLSARLNGTRVELYERINIQPGDELKFGLRKSGFRAYLGISGGFVSEEIMGSKSWYEGLTREFRLQKDMLLYYGKTGAGELATYSSLRIDTDYITSKEVEVFKGPEFEDLSGPQVQKLFHSEFTLAQSSNRMAVQFSEDLENDLQSIITGPVLPGSVQLTPSGKLIALMRDCQTTGGYPRILQLSERGIQGLSQKLPGEKVYFKLRK